MESQLENCRCELAEKEETIRRLMEHASASTYRDGGSRVLELEARCSQLESMLEIREEQVRSMGQHVAQLSLSSPHTAKVVFLISVGFQNSFFSKLTARDCYL